MNKTQKFFPKNVEKMYEKGNFNEFFDEVSIPKKVEDFKAQPIENVIHEIELLPVDSTQEEDPYLNTVKAPDSDISDEADDAHFVKSPIPQYVPIENTKSKKPIALLIGVAFGVVAIGVGFWMCKATKPTSEIIIPMVVEESNGHGFPDISTIHLPLQKSEIIPQPEPVKESQEIDEIKSDDKAVINEPSSKEQEKNIEQTNPSSEIESLKTDVKEDTEKTELENTVVKPKLDAPVKPVSLKPIEAPKPPKKVKKETPKKDIWELEADKKLQELNDTLK